MNSQIDSKKSGNPSRFTQTRKDIKIVIVGNSGVGKTSFCNQWIKGIFKEDYKVTVISEFSYKIYEYKGNYYKIQFWDIGGQDKNIYTTRVFTKDADGCLILCDITKPESLQHSLKWKKAIDDKSKFKDGEFLPCLLIQNKIDLVSEEELNNEEDLKTMVNEHNFISYSRISCKNNTNIDETMDYFLSYIIEKLEKFYDKSGISMDEEAKRTTIVLQNPTVSNESLIPQKKECC